MKIILTAAVLVLLMNALQAQKINESEVPKAVLATFQQSFKSTTAKSWKKEKDGKYEAQFERNDHEGSATFTPDGALFETENKVDKKYLPKASVNYIELNYTGYTISEVSEIVAPNGRLTYGAEIKKGKEEIDLVFDSIGSFLRKED